ncbi:MAG: hypothetical protein R3B72_14700 [Polyangiaceae bacterium]
MDAADRARLREAYRHFLKGDRVLLTGHSHQAWPDVARDALVALFDDAAALVDDKWGRIFEIQAEVGQRILRRMDLPEDDAIAFGQSTHELVFRLLSCFSPAARPKVVTTSGEFHSLYRQLRRLEEEGVEVTYVPGWPREGLAERVLEAIVPGVQLVAVSAVFFEDAYVLDSLPAILARAREVGAIPLVDAYHGFNAVPLAWGEARDTAFVTAGGYKYAGFGDGLCWLRIPRDCDLRPVFTGWFADFAGLAEPRDGRPVRYGEGAARFAGATFDASALYRARAVLDHWDRFGLDVPALRASYLAQTERLLAGVSEAAVEVVTPREPARRGSFVALRHPQAKALSQRLHDEGVWTDSRGDLLRLGPAPYLSDDELDRGAAAVTRLSRELS